MITTVDLIILKMSTTSIYLMGPKKDPLFLSQNIYL